MKSRWSEKEAESYSAKLKSMRVYTSRLLGQETELVLHGGGNTSVKIRERDFFGKEVETLFVKGSGWDLTTIEEAGFASVRMDALLKLAECDKISDTDMVEQQRIAMLNPKAPNASVEAILHAIIPKRFVDHTHADAVLAITNTENGENQVREVYGDRVIVIPYVMPGFPLARRVYELTKDIDWDAYDGMILMNHGVFTFSDDTRESYESMIALASKAEEYLKKSGATHLSPGEPLRNLLSLAKLRRLVSELRGVPVVARIDRSPSTVGYSNLDNIADIGTRGPLTPDHSIFAKRIPAILDANHEASIEQYKSEYKSYFERNASEGMTCLDPAPRWAVWPEHGIVSFGLNAKNADIIGDIARHTAKVVQMSEALGGWTPLSEKDVFDLEYWELEQDKLKSAKAPLEFQGKVAIVTGAASGIGRACAEDLLAKGASVAALDIDPAIITLFDSTEYLGIESDVTNEKTLKAAIDLCIESFGGLDIVVSNAGYFPSGEYISDLGDEDWTRSLDLNLNSHKNLLKFAIPYLKLGLDPAIVIVATRNVAAPGKRASSYSVAKAGLTQLGRIAALELAEDGIRVNVVHPDCVYDTGIWNEQTLQSRADSYGFTIDEYKTRNLLKAPVHSKEVAALISAMAGPLFAKTTGAQVPIDGGSERVV